MNGGAVSFCGKQICLSSGVPPVATLAIANVAGELMAPVEAYPDANTIVATPPLKLEAA